MSTTDDGPRCWRLSINPNIGEFWMMIDASWVNRWVLFAMAGAGPPGPITNLNLYLEPGGDVGGGVKDDDSVSSTTSGACKNRIDRE